jgi:outer membrane protein assembly factor BamD
VPVSGHRPLLQVDFRLPSSRGFLMRKLLFLPLLFLLVSCAGKKVETNPPDSDLDEPDRVLYERATNDLDRHKLTVARLTLQTLINTYPDSEYLPQAKYKLAESFYREGTSSMLTQAEAEFKDYITFFPTSDLADDAQLMVAMTHVKQIEKSDRDRTQALLAEAELKAMINDYPDSPLLDESKRTLRAIQEVLAEGVYKIGNFYYLRKSYPAAADRYREVVTKYPDFSGAPDALFNLAEALRHNNNEPESAIYYARVVSEYPLSERVNEAKQQLTAMNRPIPQPSPAALARAQQTPLEERGVFGRVLGMFSRRPPVPIATTAEGDGAQTDSNDEQTNSGNKDSGSFSIDPKVVQPENKPR